MKLELKVFFIPFSFRNNVVCISEIMYLVYLKKSKNDILINYCSLVVDF